MRTFQIVFIGDDVADAVLDPKGDRCDHAVLLDGSGEFVEGNGIQVFPGLVGIRLEIGQGHVIELVGRKSLSCCHNVFLSGGEKRLTHDGTNRKLRCAMA